MPHSRTVRRRTTPSNKSWSGLAINEQVIAGNTKVVLGTFVLSNAGIDETLLRAVGVFAIRSDQAVATEAIQGAIGIVRVSTRAVAVGATAIPGSVTDIAFDGFSLFIGIAQTFVFADATGFTNQGSVQYHFDSKAKRVTHDGDALALVVENSAAAGFQISGVIRTLSMVRGT